MYFPHDSRHTVPSNRTFPPMVTTRTTSPYLSPKTATAPLFFASSIGIVSQTTGTAIAIWRFTSASISASSSLDTGLSKVKSNRQTVFVHQRPQPGKRPGQFTFQRTVQQVCCAVVCLGASSRTNVNLCRNSFANAKGALSHFNNMIKFSVGGLFRVCHNSFRKLAAHFAPRRPPVRRFQRPVFYPKPECPNFPLPKLWHFRHLLQ